VRFTWQAQTSPDVGWVGADSKKNVTDVTVDDPRTVTFHFARVTPFLFANAVEGGILPRHAFGKEPFAEWRTHDWSKEPIASGPFLLQAHAPGQEIVLVRNPKAPEPAPLLDKVVIRIVPDVGSLLTQVEAGEIDYMEGAPPREIKRLTTVPTVKTYAFDYPMVDYLGWNEARPPLNDAEVRRALTQAIDRQALVDELLGGLGKVAAGPLPSFFPGADAKLAPLPYDPAASKRILAAKGYGEGKKPLKLEVVTNLGNRVREEALVRIQAQLAQVGVELTPAPWRWPPCARASPPATSTPPLRDGGWTGTPDLAPLFGSEARPPRGSNVVGYRSSDADAALAAASAAERWEETQAALGRLQAALHRDQPCTFLWETARLAVARRQVQGVAPLPADPLGWLRTAWIAPR
jgi:peptide/nickel transport system substrate-binding protein